MVTRKILKKSFQPKIPYGNMGEITGAGHITTEATRITAAYQIFNEKAKESILDGMRACPLLPQNNHQSTKVIITV